MLLYISVKRSALIAKHIKIKNFNLTFMTKKEQKKYDDMFPITYKGKSWKEEDCSDVFLAFYSNRDCLNWDTAVYISGGDWITPDGTIINDDDD